MAYRRSVVVGVDNSPEALQAARFACREAAARGATLVIAHAFDIPSLNLPPSAEFVEPLRRQGQHVVSNILAELSLPTARKVETVLEMSSPVMLLRQLSQDADLLVVGHHHVALIERLFGGSISGPVAARAACPVVVVPQGWTEPASRQAVVVALDGRTAAHEALEVAFAEAEYGSCPLLAVHAAPAARFQWLADEDQANILEILAGHKQDHPEVAVSTLTVPGEPGSAILAEASDARLLVVGRPHGEPHFGSWTTSVANAVLRHAQCPIIVTADSPVNVRADRQRA